MNKQPKTVAQLNRRLNFEYLEIFPYGKYKGKFVKDVSREDPNYVVWWAGAVVGFLIDPKIIAYAEEHYKERPSVWKNCANLNDHFVDWDDAYDWPETVLGDPFDPHPPF